MTGVAHDVVSLRAGERRRITMRDSFPEVVCLCGSTKFLDVFSSEMLRLTLEGRIVLTIGTHDPVARQYADGKDAKKSGLDALHFRKIELADRVHVLNVDGYIGESTKREVAHAERLGKLITWLEAV